MGLICEEMPLTRNASCQIESNDEPVSSQVFQFANLS